MLGTLDLENGGLESVLQLDVTAGLNGGITYPV